MPRNPTASTGKIGNGVNSLLCQLQGHCNPDHNNFLTLPNTAVVPCCGRYWPWKALSSHRKSQRLLFASASSLPCLSTVSPKKCFNAIKGYFSSLPLLFFFGNDWSQCVAFTSWLYNTEPTQGKHGFYLFIIQCGECLFYTMTDQKKETDSHIYLPRNTWLFEDFCYFRHYLSSKRYFSSLLLLFFFILLVNSFFEKVFNVFPCSKKNNGVSILQNSESLVAMTHDWSFLLV